MPRLNAHEFPNANPEALQKTYSGNLKNAFLFAMATAGGPVFTAYLWSKRRYSERWIRLASMVYSNELAPQRDIRVN